MPARHIVLTPGRENLKAKIAKHMHAVANADKADVQAPPDQRGRGETMNQRRLPLGEMMNQWLVPRDPKP